MTEKIPQRLRRRIQPLIDADIRKRLAALCKARGATETAVIQDALRQYLDDASDKTLLLARLDRLGRDIHRNQREVELLSEAFSIWLRLWFGQTPPIPEETRQTIRATAEGRYKQFVTHLAQQFSDGKRFIDDLPREEIANDAELKAEADRSGDPPERRDDGAQ